MNVPIDINTAEHYKVKDKHAAAGLEQKTSFANGPCKCTSAACQLPALTRAANNNSSVTIYDRRVCCAIIGPHFAERTMKPDLQLSFFNAINTHMLITRMSDAAPPPEI